MRSKILIFCLLECIVAVFLPYFVTGMDFGTLLEVPRVSVVPAACFEVTSSEFGGYPQQIWDLFQVDLERKERRGVGEAFSPDGLNREVSERCFFPRQREGGECRRGQGSSCLRGWYPQPVTGADLVKNRRTDCLFDEEHKSALTLRPRNL